MYRVNEYINIYQSTIKMKPARVKSSTYIDFAVENNEKDLNLKLRIKLEYQITKRNLRKLKLEICLKKSL